MSTVNALLQIHLLNDCIFMIMYNLFPTYLLTINVAGKELGL